MRHAVQSPRLHHACETLGILPLQLPPRPPKPFELWHHPRDIVGTQIAPPQLRPPLPVLLPESYLHQTVIPLWKAMYWSCEMSPGMRVGPQGRLPTGWRKRASAASGPFLLLVFGAESSQRAVSVFGV